MSTQYNTSIHRKQCFFLENNPFLKIFRIWNTLLNQNEMEMELQHLLGDFNYITFHYNGMENV